MPEQTQPNNPAPEETQPVSPSEEPMVDLAEEAGRAAARAAPKEQSKLRSLDELDLDGSARSKIESYVSKAINDAVANHDQKQKKQLNDDGYMNRTQIEELLATKDAEYNRREGAKESFLNVLGTEGLHPGSEGYQLVQKTYSEAVQQGKLTPEILLSEAGIRTLVAMAGVSKVTSGAASASPQSGLSRSAPDGAIAYADGTVQLNAARKDGATLEDRVRRAVENAKTS